MRPCVLIGLTACVLVMQGFQSTRPAAREEAPPMDLTGRNETIWEYLQQKYDGDNDGRITPDEYDRKGGQFDRLDRNSDGVLTDEDFASGRGGMHRGRMMRGMRAQGIVATYFQDDDDPQSLSLDELKRAVAAYDTDSDGTLRRSEFEARAEGRKVNMPGRMGRMMDMMMGDAEPWEVLTETVDANGDGDIAGEELVAFFKERDEARKRMRAQMERRARIPKGELAKLALDVTEEQWRKIRPRLLKVRRLQDESRVGIGIFAGGGGGGGSSSSRSSRGSADQDGPRPFS
ncbi:MAG: hypothetical protein IH888_03890 [Planctomycetes bacterium]|nr:hypothetical protein [Planctomycetota bacterium]